VRAWRERRSAGPATAHNSQYGPQNVPKITAARRDAIYGQITEDVWQAGDEWRTFENDDLGAARRLVREVSDYLQLVLDGLGLGQAGSGDVSLDFPPAQLRRTFTSLRERAVERQEATLTGPAPSQEGYERSLIVIEACDQVLADVGAAASETPQ